MEKIPLQVRKAIETETRIQAGLQLLTSARVNNSNLNLPDELRAKLTDAFETLLEWQDHVRKLISSS